MDPQSQATAYLESHKVTKLFRDLGTRLAFERPVDPNKFLLGVLEEIKNDEVKPFFTEQDVRACFATYDIHGTGRMTPEQYQNALTSLGIDAEIPETGIEKELFITKVMEKLSSSELK